MSNVALTGSFVWLYFFIYCVYLISVCYFFSFMLCYHIRWWNKVVYIKIVVRTISNRTTLCFSIVNSAQALTFFLFRFHSRPRWLHFIAVSDEFLIYRRVSLCSASYVSCKRGTARIGCCMPCRGPVPLRRQPCSNRSTSTRRAQSSKPAARCCSGRMRQTDGRTDTVPLQRPCCAYYARSANSMNDSMNTHIHEQDVIAHALEN